MLRRVVFGVMLSVTVMFSSCVKDEGYDFDRLFVASTKMFMEFADGSWQDGYVVATTLTPNPNWRFFPYEIEGFEYTDATEYLIHIKQYSIKKEGDGAAKKRYKLHKVVTSTIKESKSLPTTELGFALIASMKIRPKNKPLEDWYVVKLPKKEEEPEPEPEPEPESRNYRTEGDIVWGDWEFWIVADRLLIDLGLVKYEGLGNGVEYEVEYQRSNIDVNNAMSGTNNNYRIVKVLNRDEVESVGPFPEIAPTTPAS